MNKNYLRRQTDDGIKLVSFTEHPYDGLVEALRDGEVLVLWHKVAYQYGKESSKGGYYDMYTPIRSKMQFDYLLGFYTIKRKRRTKLIAMELSKDAKPVDGANIVGFYAKPENVGERKRLRREATYSDAAEYGSVVKRPTEEIALNAIMHHIPVEDMIVEERDF